MEAGNNGNGMFNSISIATSVAIGLHFIRKLRTKLLSVSKAPKGYTWGGHKLPLNKIDSPVLRNILNEEFPDHYPICDGDGYANKELRIISAPTKFDRKAMHGVDVEKFMLDQLEREVSREIDRTTEYPTRLWARIDLRGHL